MYAYIFLYVLIIQSIYFNCKYQELTNTRSANIQTLELCYITPILDNTCEGLSLTPNRYFRVPSYVYLPVSFLILLHITTPSTYYLRNHKHSTQNTTLIILNKDIPHVQPTIHPSGCHFHFPIHFHLNHVLNNNLLSLPSNLPYPFKLGVRLTYQF